MWYNVHVGNEQCKKVVGIYPLGEMLFSAENMADFINKADFIENLSEYDKTALDDLKNIYKNIEDQKNTLETQQDSLLDLKDELKKKQTELQEKAKATSTNLTEVQAKLEKAKAEEAARLEAERLEQLQQNGGYDDTITNNGGQIDASADDVTLLAAILQCEAHQNYDSLLAVATVILNRVESPRFPNTIRGVIYASGQFEPVWPTTRRCRSPRATSWCRTSRSRSSDRKSVV